MTTLLRLELTCPCCGGQFESATFGSTNTYGPLTSELYKQAVGIQYIGLVIHSCPDCGYAGHAEDFGKTTLDEPLRRWIADNLTPRLAGDGSLSGSERYIHAALIAEREERPLIEVAELFLNGAWCGGTGADDCRREAASRFELALEQDKVAHSQRATITYLVGELLRRVGETGRANDWFARVPDAVGDRDEQRWLVTLAARQATDPQEFIETEPNPS